MKTVIKIPSMYAGFVLGPKKRDLKYIMRDTNTKIVASNLTEAMALFEVTGIPKDIEAAGSLIEDMIYKKSGKVHRLGRSKTQIMFFSSHLIVIFCHLLEVKFGLISNSLIHSILETCGFI